MITMITTRTMTMTDVDRSAQLARARALITERKGGTPDPAPRRTRPRGASSATKIMVAGTAASAGLILVAAMGNAAQSAAAVAPAQTVERVVIIEVPVASSNPIPDSSVAPANDVTVIREIRELPAPTIATPKPAPAPSSGS
jgi:hypothetical protein